MQEKNKIINNFQVFYKNKFEIDFLENEIFVEKPYCFDTKSKVPLIIDCGAHIGVSILFFKSLYPNSKIIAFEPDLISFKLLEKNIKVNKLKNVDCFNYAISDFDGSGFLFGDLNEDSESVGNSIVKGWGKRDSSQKTSVNIIKLSKFLEVIEIVDYLKIDTEGTELLIIEEIKEHLNKVNEIYLEFHEYQLNSQDLEKIKTILNENFSKISIKAINLSDILTSKYPKWTKINNPYIHIIKGKK